MAQKAIPVCGSNSACYSDFSPCDCQESVDNNVGDLVAYCQGFIKGYYDTAGLPELDVSGR
jgi:hypothetical protein